MSDREDSIEWELATWEGSRREQLRRWRELTLRERFESLEGMSQVATAFADARAKGRLRTPE